MTAPAATGGNRYLALDALRGMAALLVFVHHVQLPGLHPATLGLFNGVWIFFGLSGFLIYGQFARARARGERVPLVPYLIRRVCRVYPAYLVATVGISILSGWTWYLADPVGVLTMTSTPIIVVWTLALEVQFYLVAPILDSIVSRLGGADAIRGAVVIASIGIGSLAFSAIVIAVEVALGRRVSSGDLGFVWNYLWAFAPGMALAHVLAWRPLSAERLANAGFLVAGIGLLAVSAAIGPLLFDPIAAIGTMLVIGWLVAHRLHRRLVPLATALGAISYSLYLWHEWIVPSVDRPVSTWLGSALALGLSIAVASAVFVAVERPLISVGRRVALRFDAVILPSTQLDPKVG